MAARKRGDVVVAYRNCFNSKDGKEVLLDLMRTHHILDSTYKPNDHIETIRREGERNVVLRILAFLHIKPADLDSILKEESENE